MTFEESVEACEKCDSITFMCPEHRALSRAQENEQAAVWRTDAGHAVCESQAYVRVTVGKT